MKKIIALSFVCFSLSACATGISASARLGATWLRATAGPLVRSSYHADESAREASAQAA